MNQASSTAWPDVAPDEPIPGDTWQGDALNELVPLLERNGYAVIPGTVDRGGLSVEKDGARCRIELVRPGVLKVHAEPADDPMPSDQWPMFDAIDRND